uniref:Coiled-coil domain-containing protein 181 n=1 Tax=Knipowitschia caucasica TaxID=637954 RepID=A0AAV2KY67_KNICA
MNDVVSRSQDEYEDDFEKDLDWLISEEGRSGDQGPNYEDLEAEIDKELEEEYTQRVKHKDMKQKGDRTENKILELDDEERWPSPMDPLEYDSDRDISDLEPPPSEIAEQTEEEKKPSSAIHSVRASQGRGTKRRVQSATGMSCQSTFMLSPQQKEMLLKIQEKKERLAREAEEKKREDEEQKRQENELAFKAWLMRKRERILEEKRVQRAQEMERMNCKKDLIDPDGAFRHWLQRKQVQQQRERQLVELKRLEEDTGYLLRSREDCEHAFRRWLRRKRLEKLAEQQAAREHARRLVLEERRARRMKDLMCVVNDARPFRFNEQLSYRL